MATALDCVVATGGAAVVAAIAVVDVARTILELEAIVRGACCWGSGDSSGAFDSC